MELGVAVPTCGPHRSRQAIIRVAKEAERLGYAALWARERLVYPTEAVRFPRSNAARPLDEYYIETFEPMETLAFVAAHTERIKLGTSILSTPFYSPLALARRFATLDQLSEGRVQAVGLGQGWMEQEFIATNSSRRYQGPAVNEFIAAMKAAWGEDPVHFDGKFYTIPPSLINPKPVQKGGLPIIMGAFSPSAIRRAARYADGFNPALFSWETLVEDIQLFRTAAREAGRDPSKLMIVVRANGIISTAPLAESHRPFLSGSPDQIARDLDRVRSLNVNQVFFAEQLRPNQTADTLDQFIESLGRLQAITRVPRPYKA